MSYHIIHSNHYILQTDDFNFLARIITVAFVVLKFPDTAGTNEVEKELIAFVAESLAEFKRIHRVYFIADIPKNGSGKILKQMLVRKFQKE